MKVRRVGVRVGIAVAALGAAGFGVWRWVGESGSTPIERWVGTYLLRVFQSRINPEISWKDLDYRAPRTVVLDEVKLRSGGTTIFSMKRLTLTLHERPRSGRPVQIERIEVDSPDLQIRTDERGEWIGWHDFVRKPERAAASQANEGYRVSDALRVEHFAMRDGGLTLQLAGEAATSLAGITAEMDSPRSQAGAGWYELKADVKDEPLFSMQVCGRFNVDTGRVEIAPLEFSSRLDDANLARLPGSVQRMAQKYGASGKLNLRVSGTATVPRWETAEGSVEVSLAEGRLAWAGNAFEVKTLSLNGKADGREISAQVEAAAYGGRVAGEWRSERATAGTGDLKVTAEGLSAEALERLAWVRQLLPAGTTLAGGQVAGNAMVGWMARTVSVLNVQVQVRDSELAAMGRRRKIERADIDVARSGADLRTRVVARSGKTEWEATVVSGWGVGRAAVVDGQWRNLELAELCGLALGDDARGFELTGVSRGSFAAKLDRGDARKNEYRVQIGAKDVAFRAGKVHAASPVVEAAATMMAGRAAYAATVTACGGKLKVKGDADMTASWPTRMSWSAAGMRLEELIKALGGNSTQARGNLTASGTLRGDLKAMRTSVHGDAEGRIADGNLVGLPVLSELVALIRRGVSVVPLGVNLPKDRAEFKCAVRPEGVEFERFDADCEVIAARGRGRVGFDGTLGLVVNAGPLEKVESLLGPIGSALRSVSDRLISYDVTGRVGAVKVVPKPLGVRLP